MILYFLSLVLLVMGLYCLIAKKNIVKKIIGIVAEKMDRSQEDITEQMSFVNDLGADSLDQVELIMDIEDAFDIQVPEEDAEKIETIADAIKYVEERT